MKSKTMLAKIYRTGTYTRDWLWQLRDGENHKIIGASTESYRNRRAAVDNFERVTGCPVPEMIKRASLYQFVIFR